jgi:hypothetical protein
MSKYYIFESDVEVDEIRAKVKVKVEVKAKVSGQVKINGCSSAGLTIFKQEKNLLPSLLYNSTTWS